MDPVNSESAYHVLPPSRAAISINKLLSKRRVKEVMMLAQRQEIFRSLVASYLSELENVDLKRVGASSESEMPPVEGIEVVGHIDGVPIKRYPSATGKMSDYYG